MFEADQNFVDFVELTDQGDAINFKSADALWSGKSGKSPVIRPNGLKSGGAITPESSGTADEVDIAAAVVYLAGVATNVSAVPDQAIARPTVSNYQKHSVTVTSAGVYAVVEGVEGSAFSDTRGAAGGPPWIDEDAIEVGQVWMDTQSSQVISADEIKQVENVHLERFDNPAWETKYIDVVNNILGLAGIYFHSALPQIHSEDSGSTVFGKDVYASYYTPNFVELIDAYDFSPPANAHTINTTEVYGRTKGSASRTLNAGSFNVELKDGITDNILKQVDQRIWFKFFADRLEDPYILCQGYFGITKQFPAGANINATCAIAAEFVGEGISA